MRKKKNCKRNTFMSKMEEKTGTAILMTPQLGEK